MKKFFSLLLSICLLVQLTSPAFAAETAGASTAPRPDTVQETVRPDENPADLTGTRVSGAQSNPLYGGENNALRGHVTAPKFYSGAAALSTGDYLTDDAAVLEAIASGMEQRKTTITVPWRIPASTVSTDEELLDLIFAALALAMSHTGEPTRGDSLLLSYAYLEYGAEVVAYEDGYYYINAVYDKVVYYTTAAQEAQLTAKLTEVMNSFGFTDQTDDYTKVKTIYDYICANVTYDEANLNNESYTLKFTPYAALINGTAVCQGYALLLYRMLLMAGVDNRVILGTAENVDHAWNIVALNNFYYNLDSTWDAGQGEYHYFLKCPDNFPNHTRLEAYDSADFHTYYPMAAADYVPGENPVIASGTCGVDVNWVLTSDGTMTISGTGAMDDYENASYTPWVTHLQHILRVVVEPGVTRVGNHAFTKCTNLTSVSCAAPVIGKGAFSASSGSLQSLQLLEGVEEIGDSAFSAAALGHIVLPDSLKTIGTYSFSNAGVTQVTFGSGVKEFGPYAFQRNDFVEIHVPDNVTAIGQYCFAYCEKLETISIGSGVKELLRDTFDDCTSLKNVILSEGLEAIGFQVFWNCTALTTLTLPASLKSIDKPFRDCKNLTKVIFQGDRPQFIGRAQNGTLGLNGVCLYPCTNPTWHEHIHMGYGTCWIPNHVCQNGVCTLCSAPEIYKYGRTGESAMWTLDVNGTLTYYDDGVNPQVHIGSDGLPTEEYEEFVKKIVFTEGVYAIASYAFNLYFKNVEAMFFLGDAPIMEENCFRDVTTTAYYPADNPTWTKDVMQNYGGKITWKPACVNGHTFVYVSNNDATAGSDGTKTGTCSFCSKKETFPDVGSRLTGMALTTAPDKTTYIVNEPTVDMTGAVATITCADGRTFTVNVTDDMVTSFSTSAVGTKTLTVSYRGLTTTFAVAVSKATVIFQYADGTVISRAEYSYGDTVVIPPEPEKPAGTDPEYIFRGWGKKIPATCTGNATYTAVFGPKILPGDFTGDELVTNADVSYLLWHTLFPADFPLNSDADFTADGQVTNADVSYLLWHTLFPADFPL